MAQGPMSSILVTIQITVRIQESKIRNPHSLDYQEIYQRILMKFYGALGCGLETNCLHFGDDPHHCPDPGVRSGIRSGSGKNCHNSVMLAFSGGLCSLSTSSFSYVLNMSILLDRPELLMSSLTQFHQVSSAVPAVSFYYSTSLYIT